MKQPFLFEPPAKPRERIGDERIAEKIADALIARIGVDFWEGGPQEREDLVVALMATNSDDPSVVLDWLIAHRRESGWHDEWNWNELQQLLTTIASDVLPLHQRAGKYA